MRGQQVGAPGVSPANQIWHLSGQMAQKSCRYKGKTFGSGDVAHCTGNMIVRHNAVSSPAALPAPPFPRKRLKCRTDRGFMHPTASNRALFPRPSCATSLPGGRSGPDTLVWTEGMSGWQRAGDIPGLVPGGSGPPSMPQPGGPPPMASGGYGGGALVGRFRHLALARRSLRAHHRYLADHSGALGGDQLLSLDRFPPSCAGTAEPRLHRPGRRYLVRIRRVRHPDLSWARPTSLPGISLHPDSGRSVLDGHSMDCLRISARTGSRCRSPSRAARWVTSAGKC